MPLSSLLESLTSSKALRTSLVLGLVLAFMSVYLFGAAGSDDAYITFWSAHSLITRAEILNYSLERVEQSSSLGLTLLLAVLSLPWPDCLPLIGRLVSLAALVLIAFQVTHLIEAVGEPPRYLTAVAALAFASVLYWAPSGMEMTLAAGASLWFARRLVICYSLPPDAERVARREYGLLFLSAFAWCTLRPEAPILVLALPLVVGTGLVLGRGRPRATIAATLQVSAVAGGACLLVTAFRWSYFGSLLPQPALVKSGDVTRGWTYVFEGLVQNNVILPLVILVGVATVAVLMFRRRVEAPHLAVLGLACGPLCFALLAGGDWMPVYRFLVLALPPLGILFVYLCAILFSARVRTAVVIVFLGASLYGIVAEAEARFSPNTPLVAGWGTYFDVLSHAKKADPAIGWFETHGRLRDVLTVEALKEVVAKLHQVVPEDEPLWIASGQAGTVNFFTFRDTPHPLRFIDMFSLGMRLKNCPPAKRYRRTIWGMHIPVAHVLDPQSPLRSCGIPRPDIVHSSSLNQEYRGELARHGYQVVYHGRYSLPEISFLDKKRRETVDGFVAVDKELARQAGLHAEVLRSPYLR